MMFARPRAGDHLAAEHDRHVARGIVCRIEQALVQVQLGVGEGIGHGALRAGEDDGLGAVLDEVGQRGGGVGHGVGAVQDDEPVEGVVALADGGGDAQPVARTHVGAVDVHRLHDLEIAHVVDLGNVANQLRPRQRRSEPAPVLHGGDSPSRCDDEDVLAHGRTSSYLPRRAPASDDRRRTPGITKGPPNRQPPMDAKSEPITPA